MKGTVRTQERHGRKVGHRKGTTRHRKGTVGRQDTGKARQDTGKARQEKHGGT